MNNRHYVVVVDYYSRYIEVLELRSQTTDSIIQALKATFARHGIPMVVFSDNGPCYNSAQFTSFAASYGFQHHTSSPRFPQSKGAAEKVVQTAKSLLKKSSDPFLALLSYRTTPLNNGMSPAQLLMGRQLRSTVPTTKIVLQPSTPNIDKLQQDDKCDKLRQSANYNKRYRACAGEQWHIGDKVWIPDMQSEATVTATLPYRSYQLRSSSGNIIRRNGRSLRAPLSSHTSSQTASSNLPSASSPLSKQRCRIRDLPIQNKPLHRPGAPYATRSGRVIKPVNRFSP